MSESNHPAPHLRSLALAAVSMVLSLACSKPSTGGESALQFWHTFNQGESAALRRFLESASSPRVETTILPFAQAALRFRSGQRRNQCPDLMRLDSTRIAELASDGAIMAVPADIWQSGQWLPEAAELVDFQDAHYALPQSLDGLALIRRSDSKGPWPPTSLAELESFANFERQNTEGPGLGLLIDGYWFVAYLRSFGARLPDADGLPSGNSPEALAALDYFASLFERGIAMDLLQERSPGRAMTRAFREEQLRVVYTGPWDLLALSDDKLDLLQVAAFPKRAAPRGGQVLVVPNCARKPEEAWRLARDLVAPALQAQWARELGTVPVTSDGLAQAGRLAREFYVALQASEPLPRHVHVPELFDDLTPAVEAAVGGDASSAEALAGVARAWARLYGRADGEAASSRDMLIDAGPTGGDAHEP